MSAKATRLVGKDMIPTKVSQLENDKKFQTEEQVNEKIGKINKEKLGLDKVRNVSSYSQEESDGKYQPKGTYVTPNQIPTTLPASDVYEWAKRPFKPSYSKDEIGLFNVDNTSDMDKPISTLMQKALDEKEDKSNLGELAYKDNISKRDIGLGNVNNVAITQEEVTQIGTNKTNIEKIDKQVKTNITNIEDVKIQSQQALNIAKGRTRTKVFDTYESMLNYLNNASLSEFNIGDNLLIKDLNVPDFWISGKVDNNLGLYGYYEISPLDSGKIDLTEYLYERKEIDNILNQRDELINEKINSNTEKIETIENIIGDYDDGSGTTVPNSGYVKNIYINKELSAQEVVDIIKNANLNFYYSGGSNEYLVAMSEDGSCRLIIRDSDPNGEYLRYYIEFYYPEGWYRIFGLKNDLINHEWSTSDTKIQLNSNLINFDSNISSTVGEENYKLSRIFSITPYGEDLTISKDITNLKLNIEDINANLGDIHTILDTLNGEVI